MVKIMMHGCNGVMGQVISKIVEETEGAVMACGVDRVDDGHNDYSQTLPNSVGEK